MSLSLAALICYVGFYGEKQRPCQTWLVQGIKKKKKKKKKACAGTGRGDSGGGGITRKTRFQEYWGRGIAERQTRVYVHWGEDGSRSLFQQSVKGQKSVCNLTSSTWKRNKETNKRWLRPRYNQTANNRSVTSIHGSVTGFKVYRGLKKSVCFKFTKIFSFCSCGVTTHPRKCRNFSRHASCKVTQSELFYYFNLTYWFTKCYQILYVVHKSNRWCSVGEKMFFVFSTRLE